MHLLPIKYINLSIVLGTNIAIQTLWTTDWLLSFWIHYNNDAVI